MPGRGGRKGRRHTVGQDEEAVEGVGDRAWPAMLRVEVELVRELQHARLGGCQIGQ